MTNDLEIVNFGPFAGLFPQGVRRGNTIYVSGQLSVDDQGRPVTNGAFLGQMERAYAGVRETLRRFGATMAHVVDETIFVTDVGEVMRDLEGFGATRARVYDAPTPKAGLTLVQVASLVMPELLVEIKVVAHV